MVLRRVGRDFEDRYRLEPWLVECFNDTEAFEGTCYQAANWVKVGLTQGRGRQDRQWHCPTSVKDIYVYPLRPDFRTAMGVEPSKGPSPLGIADGLEGDEWAQNEFGDACLGDQRLGKRLVDSARAPWPSSRVRRSPAWVLGQKSARQSGRIWPSQRKRGRKAGEGGDPGSGRQNPVGAHSRTGAAIMRPASLNK